jgi:hypothetical protein
MKASEYNTIWIMRYYHEGASDMRIADAVHLPLDLVQEVIQARRMVAR